MPRRLITSPTFLDLQRINLSSPDLIIATAFYSRAALNVLQGTPKRLRLYFRLDLSDPSEWIQGSIAPDALLDTANRLAARGTEVGIFVNPGAHAKLYIGTAAAMVGSANLTLRAFSGSPELLYEIVDARERKQLEAEAE